MEPIKYEYLVIMPDNSSVSGRIEGDKPLTPTQIGKAIGDGIKAFNSKNVRWGNLIGAPK